MKAYFKSTGSIFLALLIMSAFVIGSCGGGGDAVDGAASQTGTAALLLRDAVADEYDSINLCVNKVTLEPGSEVVFEAKDGCVEVDLLDHHERPFLLNVKDVRARTYNQIRMTVDSIETQGGPCDSLAVKLPSGVIKINPRGGIPIKSGDKVVIDVDVKANQSVNVHTAGKSGQCIFRPVIFAEAKTVDKLPPDLACPRILNGIISAINMDGDEVVGFKLKLRHSKYDEVQVSLDQDTAVFDENGKFADPSSLQIDQSVKVRGEIQSDLTLLASVVAIGDLINLHGTALGAVDGDFKFMLNLDPGQAVLGEISVAVDTQTLILIDCRTEVGMDAIKAGTGVRAIGKLAGDDLIAVALFLEKINNYGTIEHMQATDNGYNMEFIPAGNDDSVTIYLPDTAGAKMEGDGSIDKDLLTELVNCKARQARVVLNELDNADNPVADLVEVKYNTTGGKIMADGVDTKLERITLADGQVIQAQGYATILKDNQPVAFYNLKDGDDITVFGLDDCQDNNNGIDFYGFVIIIEND